MSGCTLYSLCYVCHLAVKLCILVMLIMCFIFYFSTVDLTRQRKPSPRKYLCQTAADWTKMAPFLFKPDRNVKLQLLEVSQGACFHLPKHLIWQFSPLVLLPLSGQHGRTGVERGKDWALGWWLCVRTWQWQWPHCEDRRRGKWCTCDKTSSVNSTYLSLHTMAELWTLLFHTWIMHVLTMQLSR